jgi:hypothetical protein
MLNHIVLPNYAYPECLGWGTSSTSTKRSFSGTAEIPSVSKMKKRLVCKRFHSMEGVQNEVKKWLGFQGPLLFMKDMTIDISQGISA